VNGFPGFQVNPSYGNGSGPFVHATKRPAQRALNADDIRKAIPNAGSFSKTPLLPAALSDKERIAEAGRLIGLARKGLNGFANKAAEASGTKISPSDCPIFKTAYEQYVEAVGLYKEVLSQLWPESSEAMDVKQLLIDAHKAGIDTINCNIEAVDFAPKEKRHKLYSHWEGCIIEAIRELYALSDQSGVSKA